MLNGFPEKILELNELLKTPLLNKKNMSDIHEDLNVPVPDPIVLNNSDSAPSAKRPRLDAKCACGAVDGTRVMALPNGKKV